MQLSGLMFLTKPFSYVLIHNWLTRDSSRFILKGQNVKILGFAGLMVSVTKIPLGHCTVKAALDKSTSKHGWVLLNLCL